MSCRAGKQSVHLNPNWTWISCEIKDWLAEDADFALDMIPIADRFSARTSSHDDEALASNVAELFPSRLFK